MDLETLRNRQAPLKQKYKESPESGVLTMKVLGRIEQPDIAINIPTHTGSVQAGLPAVSWREPQFGAKDRKLKETQGHPQENLRKLKETHHYCKSNIWLFAEGT